MQKRDFLREFQDYINLVPDGIAGKKTFQALKQELSLSSDLLLAHFYAVCKHESGNFVGSGRENLNYSAKALKEKFPHYFPSMAMANEYARQPERIANHIYGRRMGNARTGDGWKYRGIGAIQLTGRSNITKCLEHFGIPSTTNIEILLHPKYYFKAAKYFFDINNIWDHCIDTTENSVLIVARAVNLGDYKSLKTPINMKERYRTAKEIFNILDLI